MDGKYGGFEFIAEATAAKEGANMKMKEKQKNKKIKQQIKER